MGRTQPIRNKKCLEDFKNYYGSEHLNRRNYTLIVMGLNTALRISDILSLTWGDVYFFAEKRFKSHIEITEQKTGKQNVILLNRNIIEALAEYKKCCSKEQTAAEMYLFTGQKNPLAPLSRQQAFRIIKKAAAAAGMPNHVSCHSLRKTFGYHAWKQGTPPALLMDIYNHSSYQITKRYLCIEQDDKDAVFSAVTL